MVGEKAKIASAALNEIDVRGYAKYLLREGSTTEKRELLANLRSRLICKNKTLTLTEA